LLFLLPVLFRSRLFIAGILSRFCVVMDVDASDQGTKYPGLFLFRLFHKDLYDIVGNLIIHSFLKIYAHFMVLIEFMKAEGA